MTDGPGRRQARLGTAPAAGELDAAERMPVDELRALQLERLRWTLRHAYANVPLYRKKFDAAGVSPEDCRALEDLAAFPVTTKNPACTRWTSTGCPRSWDPASPWNASRPRTA
jgi:phenylacetate-CoA ligase